VWFRIILLAVSCAACTPKADVSVRAPEKPIVINLHVKIEHEIRIKVDKDLDELYAEDKGLF
jgi:hypothetical protein